MNNKFNIGQRVYSKVARRSSSEPTIARPGSRFTVCGIYKFGDMYQYKVEAYDFYDFNEDELMSAEEYAEKILQGYQ